MWRRIKRSLIAFAWTVGGLVAFLTLMSLLLDYSAQTQYELAVKQARLDVMVAQEIYEAELTSHMEICTDMGAPAEVCIMAWVSGGKR